MACRSNLPSRLQVHPKGDVAHNLQSQDEPTHASRPNSDAEPSDKNPPGKQRLWETSRTVQVDICPDEVGFVATVGPVSLRLKHDEAKDMVATLTRALIRAASLREEQEPDVGSTAVAARARGAPAGHELTRRARPGPSVTEPRPPAPAGR